MLKKKYIYKITYLGKEKIIQKKILIFSLQKKCNKKKH